MWKTSSTAVLILMLTSCCPAPQVIYRVEPLPLPEPRNIPAIRDAELLCLSDVTYGNLARRDHLRRQEMETCRALIASTHSDK